MARTLSDVVRRFRPTVAPGPAGAAGVPADRVAETEAELGALFAALEPAIVEARQVREQARAEAERRRRRAVEEAERITAAARARVAAVRAEAASGELAALDDERAELDLEARAEAARVRRVGEARLPGLVAQVLDEVWATAGLVPSGPSATDRELTG